MVHLGEGRQHRPWRSTPGRSRLVEGRIHFWLYAAHEVCARPRRSSNHASIGRMAFCMTDVGSPREIPNMPLLSEACCAKFSTIYDRIIYPYWKQHKSFLYALSFHGD